MGCLKLNPSCVPSAVKSLLVREQGRGMQPQCWRCWVGVTMPCISIVVVLRQPSASGEEGPWGSGGPHAVSASVPGEPALSVAKAETMSLARVLCLLSCRVLVWLGGLRACCPPWFSPDEGCCVVMLWMVAGVEVGHFCKLWALPGVSRVARTSLALGLPQLLGYVDRKRMLTSAACPMGRNGLKPNQADVIPLVEQGGRVLV